MPITVTTDDITDRLPDNVLPLTEHQRKRIDLLIADAIDEITIAFHSHGRDLDAALRAQPWLATVARRVVRDMVSAAVIVGPSAGVRSISSTTGPQADSVTYHDGAQAVSFGGVLLTAQHLEDLGLGGVSPRGTFPRPHIWPEGWPA